MSNYDSPNYCNKYYKYGDESNIYASYGSTTSQNQTYEYHFTEPVHFDNESSVSYAGAFCKTFIIINGFAILTIALFFLIDYIVNKEIYWDVGNNAVKIICARIGLAIFGILISWYLLMIPIFFVVAYNKRHNTTCYKIACNMDSVCCCCYCLNECSNSVCEICRFMVIIDILTSILGSLGD